MEILKPCPFCGGEAHISVSSDGYGVECSNDRCIDMLCLNAIPTEAEAIKAWNTRAERTCKPSENSHGYLKCCSECGRSLIKFAGILFNYCPNCGAKVAD